MIRHRITDFLDAIPNYELLRRFLERTRECSGIDDHEVATYFLAKFPTHSLEYITSDNCDTMALFIEYFPKDGLGWLYEAITCSDCSAFSEMERQIIVYVCEKLSFLKSISINVKKFCSPLPRMKQTHHIQTTAKVHGLIYLQFPYQPHAFPFLKDIRYF